MSDQKNIYGITVERVNSPRPRDYLFNIWTDEALGGEWCLELAIGNGYEYGIGAHWANGDARYFADAAAAFAHIETMIFEQEQIQEAASNLSGG